MIARYALAAALLGLAAFALWHPAATPVTQSVAATPIPQPSGEAWPTRHRHHPADALETPGDLIVYVAGAVRRPGLYHLHTGDRNAQAVLLAGGMSEAADAAAINLAQRVADGDEIDVPAAGQSPLRSAARYARHRSARHRSPRHPPSDASIDVNQSGAAELAAVPGIGHAIAQRIIELREREGNFATLDELLDVAGMTQSRLERARPYLRQP